jgi:hypothetical protein
MAGAATTTVVEAKQTMNSQHKNIKRYLKTKMGSIFG